MNRASSTSEASGELLGQQDNLDERVYSKKTARKRPKTVQVQLKSIAELKKEAEKGAHDGKSLNYNIYLNFPMALFNP